MQSIEARNEYKNSFNCAAKIFRDEGFLTFWSGAVPRLARLILSGGIVFTMFVHSKIYPWFANLNTPVGAGTRKRWKALISWIRTKNSSDYVDSLWPDCYGTLMYFFLASLHQGMLRCCMVEGEVGPSMRSLTGQAQRISPIRERSLLIYLKWCTASRFYTHSSTCLFRSSLHTVSTYYCNTPPVALRKPRMRLQRWLGYPQGHPTRPSLRIWQAIN